MAKHTIVINPFSPKSIDMAIKQLDDFSKDFNKKFDLFLDRLAEFGCQTASSLFGGATEVRVETSEGKRMIVATGTDDAYFLEFGTGVYAGTTQGQYLEFPSIVYPGSYSEQHAKTWVHWMEAGKNPEDYPWNSEPQSPMYKTYVAMRQNYYRIAKEVFG